MHRLLLLLACALSILGCPATGPADADTSGPDAAAPSSLPVEVLVTIDGVPSPNTSVSQGGHPARWTTDDAGRVRVELDLSVPGERVVIASHPEARIRGVVVSANPPELVTLALTRFDTTDNEAYLFKDPGEPGMSHIIEKCGHCHVTLQATWFESAHKTSASNPIVQDIYQGTAASRDDAAACELAGGDWTDVQTPGTSETTQGCVMAPAVSASGGFGACADCHAPGMDGVVGGRDLLEAQGHAYTYGVHCDVCHHTESVDLLAEAGVAGRLRLLRPSEPSPIPGLGEHQPLTFCPNDDSPNIYMGCVQRDHFRQSAFCAGCHEQTQPALMPNTEVDEARWPQGRIPVHTTFSEWQSSVFGQSVTCQDCHMPAAPDDVQNGADLQLFNAASTGITGGWPRAPGATRLHTWSGPRSPDAYQMPAPLALTLSATQQGDEWVVEATAQNVGAGHSVPTGEPLRSVILRVDATCGDTPLVAIGGSAIPDLGGSLSMKDTGEDWTVWDKGEVGMQVRVIRNEGFIDYQGYGVFGDGTFTPEDRGLRDQRVVGTAAIVGVDNTKITLDAPLPEGDRAYLVHAASDDEATHAGAPGFAFARVLTDGQGKRMVPHFMAVDVVSDNRLQAQQSWTSTHRFQTTCEAPTVRARLIQRAYPLWLAQERGWPLRDRVWVTATLP